MNIFELVKSVPISKVIEKRIDIKGHGSNIEALCPFHNDTKYGSFKINDNKGFFKCFSCDEKGDAVGFIAKIDGVSRIQAAQIICKEFNLLSDEYLKDVVVGKKIERTQERTEVIRQDEETINFIYKQIAKGQSLIDSSMNKLSDEHLAYLKSRGLSDSDIEEVGYFTFPSKKASTIITNLLKKRGLNVDETLHGVPGFYRNKAKKFWSISVMEGIGIPIKNWDGSIVALQVRRDVVKEGESRYRWFSSAFADNNDKSEYGTSAGAPTDVHYAEKPNNVMFITEGHFKARKIAKELSSIALSVQGITTWSGLNDEIQNVIDNIHQRITRIYIAFDADMAHNSSVVSQMVMMMESIKEQFPEIRVCVALWDEALGKGIDDMIENGHKSKLCKLDADEFVEPYTRLLTAKGYEDIKDLREIPEKSLEYFYKSEILNVAIEKPKG